MASSNDSKLFQPFRIGNTTLSHRIVMAPLTRFRADENHVPLSFVKEYYTQRAAVPGTLIISEGTLVSLRLGAFPNMPGIWSDEQIAAWKEIVDAIHAKGCFIFCQIHGNGRCAPPEWRAKDGFDLIGPSPIPVNEGFQTPREMTEQEILDAISDFKQAAINAVEKAGFDGVEIHAANGHLVDQFVQDVSNQRTDSWGGSVEKRARFAIDIAKAVGEAVGYERVGVRFSPFSRWLNMRMGDPVPQFVYLIKELKKLGTAFLHLIQSRTEGDVDTVSTDSIAPFIDAWGSEKALILAGGYSAGGAQQAVDGTYKGNKVAIAFGRHFISNPDLVFRVNEKIEFAPYNRATFYNAKSREGYTDYEHSEQYLASQRKASE
ncbi:hypothetical protein BDV96DRAFT_485594 [Lophiotrema nucula]|uniref:NADH:flavin oxidoreductase/NADH oxidase N-terminal domain-containing protein n=1 Tax=Lophiotrema nucula TaxID=690887 RepID=A0A6A5ZKI3_9PLEO|nr:hypothetical protein BDV96DRAFT_485594 [Lophiotrema nucula]